MIRSIIVAGVFWFSIITVSAQTDFSDEVQTIQSKSLEKGGAEPVIFIGSSSIRMWKSLEQDFPNFSVLNHGFGGSEYSDIVKYQEQLIEEFEPSVIVVYAGDNDIANEKTPEKVAEDADMFIDALRRSAAGALVIVISAKPSVARWELKDKYIELNTLLKQMADSYDHVVFVDVWSPMLKSNGEVNAKLFLEDGLHMNEKGYAIWKNALLPFLSH